MATFVYNCTKCKTLNCSQMELSCCKWCCGKLKLQKTHVPDKAPGGFVKKGRTEWKTVGDLAKSNRETMSDEEYKLRQKRTPFNEKRLPKGAKVMPKVDAAPEPLDRVMLNMTDAQKRDYIERGVRPTPAEQSSIGQPISEKTKRKRDIEKKEDMTKRKVKKKEK